MLWTAFRCLSNVVERGRKKRAKLDGLEAISAVAVAILHCPLDGGTKMLHIHDNKTPLFLGTQASMALLHSFLIGFILVKTESNIDRHPLPVNGRSRDKEENWWSARNLTSFSCQATCLYICDHMISAMTRWRRNTTFFPIIHTVLLFLYFSVCEVSAGSIMEDNTPAHFIFSRKEKINRKFHGMHTIEIPWNKF